MRKKLISRILSCGCTEAEVSGANGPEHFVLDCRIRTQGQNGRGNVLVKTDRHATSTDCHFHLRIGSGGYASTPAFISSL